MTKTGSRNVLGANFLFKDSTFSINDSIPPNANTSSNPKSRDKYTILSNSAETKLASILE